MSKKVSRRDFARASVAAGAAVATVAIPKALLAETGAEKILAGQTTAATKGAAVARRRRFAPPPDAAYGGLDASGRGMMLDANAYANQTTSYPSGWRESTTIPAEYYLDEKHYLNDDRFVADHFWLMVDHESRIRKPGDYFVFEYGRGDSVIVVRDQAGTVKAFHNVCRHRGSRLCQHETQHPSEARADGKPTDSPPFRGPTGSERQYARLSLPVSCVDVRPERPAHLVAKCDADYFNKAENGLRPCHVQTAGGFIFINLSHQDPPDFESFIGNWRESVSGLRHRPIEDRGSSPVPR